MFSYLNMSKSEIGKRTYCQLPMLTFGSRTRKIGRFNILFAELKIAYKLLFVYTLISSTL